MLSPYPRLSLCFLALWLLSGLNPCTAQTDDVLCRAGSGKFEADFHREIRIHVGAAKSGGLATRTCEATLSSGGQDVTVASGVWEVDLDAFGADLGMGVPVAAFQIKKSEQECCTEYLIYSLQKPPRLLRTLFGGTSIHASDIDLDTRVEIWTDDAAAVDGLDNIAASELNFPPPVAFRFERNQLLDAGPDFQPYFDQRIAKLKTQIDPRDLRDFKNSDGKLAPGGAFPPEVRYRLRKVKIGVLEIVLAYLNSGREHDAWAAIADMWPGMDIERIRQAIVKAREHGIHAQAEGVAATARKKKRATIYDVTMSQGDESEVTSPRPILLWRPPAPSGQIMEKAEISIDLIIDSVGKVRFASGSNSTDADLIGAAMGWKFIPAQRGGHAVASRTRLAVSLRR